MSLRFHFDFTSMSLRVHLDFISISLRFHFNLTLASLKTLANHSENGSQRDHSHRGTNGTEGTNEVPKVLRKTNESLSILIRTHPGSTRDGPSSRRTTFHSISHKTNQAPKSKGHAPPPRSTNQRINPSDTITHTGTIKISRSE